MIFSKTKILFFTVLLFYTIISNSQESGIEIVKKDSIPEYIEINGLVLDIEPLSKVVVLERGKNNVVMTDNVGKFSIRIPFKNFKNKVYLRFEVLNLKPKEIEVKANTKYIKIQLTESDGLTKGWNINYEVLKPDISNWVLRMLTKSFLETQAAK